MNQQLTHISPLRAAISFGIVGYVLGFPLLGLMHLFANFASRPNYTPLQLAQVIAIPLSVALLSLAFALIGSVTYNLVARFGVAIQFKVKQTENV